MKMMRCATCAFVSDNIIANCVCRYSVNNFWADAYVTR